VHPLAIILALTLSIDACRMSILIGSLYRCAKDVYQIYDMFSYLTRSIDSAGNVTPNFLRRCAASVAGSREADARDAEDGGYR
jgi:hypothetical protein